MKTKTLLLSIFCIFFSTALWSQYQIIGPYSMCEGECGDYALVGPNGQIVNDPSIEWYVTGDFNANSGSGYITACFYGGGGVVTALIDGATVAEIYVETLLGPTPEIITLDGALCTTDSLNSNACEQVCENSTATYVATGVDPTWVFNWYISGEESYTENGNTVSVNWGEAGNGFVNLSVYPYSNAPQFYIDCFMESPVSTPGDSDGVGAVFINGVFGSYEVHLSNGMVSSGGTNEPISFFNLSAGTYSLTVTDQVNNTAECSFTITEAFQACDPVVLFNTQNPQSCDFCDGIIYPGPTLNVSAPLTYAWNTGETTASLTGVCPGTYSVTIYDAEGCSEVQEHTIYCEDYYNYCEGYANALCVNILETPEAKFLTNPPVNNGGD